LTACDGQDGELICVFPEAGVRPVEQLILVAGSFQGVAFEQIKGAEQILVAGGRRHLKGTEAGYVLQPVTGCGGEADCPRMTGQSPRACTGFEQPGIRGAGAP
jgi:hypothetical protein